MKIFILKKRKNFFIFKTPTLDDAENELKGLGISKASPSLDIPAKFLKENVDLFSPSVSNIAGVSIDQLSFPSVLKLAKSIQFIKKTTLPKH